MSEEVWKWVPGYEGYYQVSNQGRVRSVKRDIIDSRGVTKHLKGQTIAPRPDRDGYHTIYLCKDGIPVVKKVHNLILTTFVGECPEGMQTHHLDSNPANNRLENLRWITFAEHIADRVQNGSIRKGEAHPFAKLRDTQIPEIRCLHATGRYTQRKIADAFGVSSGTIQDVVSCSSWKHIPEKQVCIRRLEGQMGAQGT